MSARETTTETPAVEEQSDQGRSKLSEQAVLTEFIKSIEDNPTKVDVLRKGVVSESVAMVDGEDSTQKNRKFAVLKVNMNGVRRRLKIKFDSSKWDRSREYLFESHRIWIFMMMMVHLS